MELYIYNSELELLGLVDIFDSLRWRRRYFQPGEFELHLKATAENIALFQEQYIVARHNTVEAGIIENIEISTDNLVVKGRFLSSLLERRIVLAKTTLNTTAELAMRILVSNMTPIPKLELGELKGFTETVDIQVTYKNIAVTLTKIAQVSNIGYTVKFDRLNKKLLFECYKGIDRSASQDVNARAIFSEEFENVTDSKYTLATENYRTVALVGGEGEDTDRILVMVGEANGLTRREIFVDAKDLKKENLTDEQYKFLLRQRGIEALTGAAKSEVFESNVNLQSNLVYKKDFDLGDVVTCRNRKWNKKIDVRITEIEEVYENGILTITPTFGSPLPELKDVLKEE
ncbi:siphovirus ReqiPepy6 Gp37-like family protein [Ruminiclostridium herbifermentans]|uniref:Siphovirus ReqiPepy6 Gp37-like family protein n=1 Tax=Ruminiclostridium herbifermentans TaxID=2488810 RepID=A0A4U7JBL2_9FIRM|nr:siphovirus ReqiPepy6 Gp37-like family protein [Ruminiclostridium herbifermentans]QNU66913.1 siphovirus ReqiPepy6 Gp37-like family protein [Ruminiclostridium herbifermentans]